MSRRILSLFVCLALLPGLAFAQESGTIEGTITDARSGESIPGVQVYISSLAKGAVSDMDGQYAIENVQAGTYTIQASYIGFRKEETRVTVEAGQTTTLDFQMRSSSIDLDEVVVTGTGGPVEKRKLGNSIATINAADLSEAPVQSFSDILQGREPGLSALPSGGLTGEGTRIRIRGSSSLSQSNEPLVYIDGVRVSNGGGFGAAQGGFVGNGGGGSPSRLDDIDPEAIERIEVLKGAAAATLFGTEASNGVIQVFTKRGTAGPPQFTFGSRFAAIRYPDAYPDQVGFARTQAQVDRMSQVFGRDVQRYELVSQNVPEALVGTGFSQEYFGNVRGGGDTAVGGVTYFVSGRYLGENGPFEGSDALLPPAASVRSSDEVQRAMGTANIEILPNEDLRLRVTSGFFNTNFETLQTNNNIYGTISLAQFSKPEFVAENNLTGTTAFATVAESMQQTVSQETRHFNGSANANYKPIESLTLDAIFGVDYTSSTSEELRPFGWNVNNFSSDEVDGAKRFATLSGLEITVDTKVLHSTEFEFGGSEFSSDLTLGAQGFITRSTLESGQGIAFPGPGFAVSSAASQQALFESFSEVVNAGIFGQEQFGYSDYLFVTVGARYDANSAFGEEFSGIFYPKVSASIIPSDAPFWGGDIGPISSIRFRAALGQSGLQPGAFDALTTFESLNAGGGAGVVPSNLGNSNLKPEISTEWELGTEIGLFNDRAALEGTYWNRTVNDALVSRQFPVSGGFRAQQLVNIGELKGQGIEIATRALVYDSEDLSIDLFANAAYLWEQITDLGEAPPIKVGGSYPRYRNYLVEGFAPGTHFGVQLQNVPSGQLPVDITGPTPGVPDGQPDTEAQLVDYLGSLSADDLTGGAPFYAGALPASTSSVLLATNPDSPTGTPTDLYLGKPTPDWEGAFGADISFLKNFKLSTLFEYKTGNFYINNLTDAFRQSNAVIGRNLPTSAQVERDFITGGVDGSGNPENSGEVRLEALKGWLNENLALAPFSGLNTIKKADFVRWRELSLTYNVPANLVERFGGRSLSLTFAGRNLALWTKYDGVDPELNAIGRGGGANALENNFLSGVEAFGFPVPRRYSVQLRLGF